MKIYKKNLKQLKHSQGSYIGHITKAINKIGKFIIDKEHIEQIKYLEEQLEKHIKKLKIVIDEYCDISESLEQHDIMNECFLQQNTRVLKAKNTISNYICSHDTNPLQFEMKPSQKSYAVSIKSDSSKGSQKSNSSKNSQKSHLSNRSSNHSYDKSISNKSKSSGKSSIKSISKEQAELIKIQTEERVNRKLKLLEKRKQLEFEIAKDEVYEELLEAQNQLEIAELLEKKEFENIKTEYQEKVNKKLSISKSKSLESSYSEDIGELNVKNKS